MVQSEFKEFHWESLIPLPSSSPSTSRLRLPHFMSRYPPLVPHQLDHPMKLPEYGRVMVQSEFKEFRWESLTPRPSRSTSTSRLRLPRFLSVRPRERVTGRWGSPSMMSGLSLSDFALRRASKNSAYLPRISSRSRSRLPSSWRMYCKITNNLPCIFYAQELEALEESPMVVLTQLLLQSLDMVFKERCACSIADPLYMRVRTPNSSLQLTIPRRSLLLLPGFSSRVHCHAEFCVFLGIIPPYPPGRLFASPSRWLNQLCCLQYGCCKGSLSTSSTLLSLWCTGGLRSLSLLPGTDGGHSSAVASRYMVVSLPSSSVGCERNDRTVSRPLSLQSLFLGYECGGVFPAVVGCKAWLTLKRYNQLAALAIQPVGWDAAVWLIWDGVHQVRLCRAPIWCSSGGNGTREAGGTVGESLVGCRSTRKRTVAHSIGRVRTRFGEGGGQLDRRRARGMRNPCAREWKGLARTGRVLRGNLIADFGPFSSYGSQQWAANGQDSWGVFQGCTGLWTVGCWLARRLHQSIASTAIDLFITFSLIFAWRVTSRNSGLLIKTNWSVVCPLCCLERWSCVGDNNPSRSSLLSIWSKEAWWTVLTLVGAIACKVRHDNIIFV